jgi:hypothetical protein
MKVLIAVFALVLPFLSFQAHAADIRPELEKCRGMESMAYRLQCYDDLVDGLNESGISTRVPDPVAPARTPVVAQPAAPAATPRTSASQAVIEQEKVNPEDLFGKGGDELKRELEIDSVDKIASEVTQVRIAPNKEYVVYLANGQVWRQKDKIGKWRIKVGERAIIEKATLGSYLMRSDARKRSVRAERLR